MLIETSLVLARAVHFAATLSVGGVFAFATFVARPVLKGSAIAPTEVKALQSRLTAIVWASLGATLVSGVLWFGLEAQAMSGRPMAAVLVDGTLWTMLTRTEFGHVASMRLVIALVLAACLCARRWRSSPWHRASLDIAALTLGAALAATLAWTGHAAATEGGNGIFHLLADIAHLLAAMTWLGALLPLALFLAAAPRGEDPAWAVAVKGAVDRFSALGVASVATILISGTLNTWFLAGTAPALLGTTYGHWLLLKIALFLAMIGVAAVNRFRLTPRLSHAPRGRKARDSRDAAHRIRRNALIEAALGVLVLCVVGFIGTLPPGLHTEPIWPLPFRLPTEDPQLGPAIGDGAAAVVFGIGIMVGSLALRRSMSGIRSTALAIGIMLVFYGAVHVGAPAIPAYPTSYATSPTGYTVASIASGRELFAAHCAACHGNAGRGDGPLAKILPAPPADLTADHIYAHLDGELFWWITSGIDDVMPGFGSALDAQQRWSLIDFIHANADATRFSAASTEPSSRYIRAPDFTAQCGDRSTVSLQQLQARIVRLVFLSAEGEKRYVPAAIDDDGVFTVIAAATHVGIGAYCVASAPQIAGVYRSYLRRESIPDGAEFLIDTKGSLRAAWYPGLFQGDENNWREPRVLQTEIEKIRRAPVAKSTPSAHIHAH